MDMENVRTFRRISQNHKGGETSQAKMKTGLTYEIKSVIDKLAQNIQDMKTSQMKTRLTNEIKLVQDKLNSRHERT